MTAKQIFYEGHVQGVGFRWSIKRIAHGFDVTGSVRNLPDGRVELQIAGTEEELTAFLDAIAQSELRAHIKKQTEAPTAAPANARGFEIRHD
jgi:acylphosphatase